MSKFEQSSVEEYIKKRVCEYSILIAQEDLLN
jgi:hypothetical protein